VKNVASFYFNADSFASGVTFFPFLYIIGSAIGKQFKMHVQDIKDCNKSGISLVHCIQGHACLCDKIRDLQV